MNQCIDVEGVNEFDKRRGDGVHNPHFKKGISDDECQRPPLYMADDHQSYCIKKFFTTEDNVTFKEALEQFTVIFSIVDGLSSVEIEDEHHDKVLQLAWKNMNHLVCILFDPERQKDFQSNQSNFGGVSLFLDMIRDIQKNAVQDRSQYGLFLKRFMKEKFIENWSTVLNSHNAWYKSPTSLAGSFLMAYADNGTIHGRVAIAHVATLVEWVVLGKMDEALAFWTATRYVLYPAYVQKSEDTVKEKVGEGEVEEEDREEEDTILATLNFRQVTQTKTQVVTGDRVSLDGNWMEQVLIAGTYPDRIIDSIREQPFQASIDYMKTLETFQPVVEQWMLDSTCPTLLMDYFENPSKNEFCSGPNLLFVDIEEEDEVFSIDQVELKKKIRRYSRVILQGIQGTDVETLTFLDMITLASQNFRTVIQSLGRSTGKRYSIPIHSLLWYTGKIKSYEQGYAITLYKSKVIKDLTRREDNRVFTWTYNFKQDAGSIFDDLPFYNSKDWNSRMEKLEEDLKASGAGADVEFIEESEVKLLKAGKPEPIKDDSIPQLEEQSPTKRKRTPPPPPLKRKKRYCSPPMRPDKGEFGNSIEHVSRMPVATLKTRSVAGLKAKRLSRRVPITSICGSTDTGLVWIDNKLFLSYELPDDDIFIKYLVTVWHVKDVTFHICVLMEDNKWKIFFFGEADLEMFESMRGGRVKCNGNTQWLGKKEYSSAQMASILYPPFVTGSPLPERRLYMRGDDVFITNGNLRRGTSLIVGDTAKVERFAQKHKKKIAEWKDFLV